MNEELKYCKFCNKQKPIKDFCKSGGFIKNICRECHNKKQKERYANSKLVEEKDKEIERLNNIINELHKLIEQDWGYYGSFVYNSRAEFDDEEQVNKFWQDYGKKEIVKKYRDKIKELKGDSSNE